MKKVAKKKWMVVFVLILMLTFVACGTNNENEKSLANSDQELEDTEEIDLIDKQSANDRDSKVDGVEYKDAEVTPEDAFDKFIDLHPEAKVTEIKLEIEDGELEYKIEGYDSANEYQVKISAKSADVKSDDIKNLDEDDKDEALTTKDHIKKINGLIDKALKDLDENARFKKWSLEDEDGSLEFEIEFKDRQNQDIEYTYDLESGNLIKKED